MLERDSQLAALREYADDAARGVGRLVLIEGEAGIGKSSLIEQFEVSLTEARWLWGACEGLSTPRPLAPLYDIADQMGGELDALCGDHAPRDRLFDALVDQLCSEQRLCVLVFEDVHWADDATLDLLRRLARRLQRLTVLVLVSFRDDHPAPGLQAALGELVRQRTVRRVTLPTLSIEAVRELVADRDMDSAEVLRLTGGNPYFVAELLAVGHDGLARSARDAVLARVGALSDGARTSVEAAALLGTRVDPDVLTKVAEVPTVTHDELVAAGLVLVVDRSLRFRHEITRLAVADAVPPFRAAQVHERALAVLAQRGGADASRLAFHAEGAGDAVAVVEHSVRAAHEASGLSSHREAVEHYRRALGWCDDADGALRRSLATELGLLDRWEEAEVLWREAIDVTSPQDPRSLGEAVRMHSRALWRLSRGEQARTVARAAVEILEPLGPSAELARARGELAGSEMMQGEAVAAEASANEALALADQFGLSDVASDALNVLACLLVDTGGDWEALLRRALSIARQGGASSQAGRCYVNLYSSFVDLDRVAQGESTFAEGLAYIEEHEVPVYGFCLLASRAEALEMTGRWDESLDLAVHLRDTPMSPINRMHLELGPTRIAVRRGTPEAGEAVRRLVDFADRTQEPQWVAPTRCLRAEWHWLGGRHEEARADVLVAAAAARESRLAGRVSVWQQRLGLPTPDPTMVGEPYATQIGEDFLAAAAAWDARQMAYEAALARYDSADAAALREALESFQRLHAEPMVRLTRRRLREHGVRVAGSRRSTLEHPAGLTLREQEVLELVCGGCSNAEIASRLVISVKTAGHHVSALLAKLGVDTRHEAAEAAQRRGLGPQHRESATAT